MKLTKVAVPTNVGGRLMTSNEERSFDVLKTRLSQLVDEFRERLISGTSDSDNFLTISEIENLWSELRGNTGILYSDLLEETLKVLNEREIISKKNGILEKGNNFTNKQAISTFYINN